MKESNIYYANDITDRCFISSRVENATGQITISYTNIEYDYDDSITYKISSECIQQSFDHFAYKYKTHKKKRDKQLHKKF